VSWPFVAPYGVNRPLDCLGPHPGAAEHEDAQHFDALNVGHVAARWPRIRSTSTHFAARDLVRNDRGTIRCPSATRISARPADVAVTTGAAARWDFFPGTATSEGEGRAPDAMQARIGKRQGWRAALAGAQKRRRPRNGGRPIKTAGRAKPLKGSGL
jgi:hypothetical protein